MAFHAVMFDLDGTLADTLRDIAESGNHAMRQVNRPTFPVDRYRTLAGQGLARLIEDALGPEHQSLFNEAYEHFRDHYAEHRFDHCKPYPGVAELLDRIVERGLPMAVMSNKPDEATRDMVRRVFGRWEFAEVRVTARVTP